MRSILYCFSIVFFVSCKNTNTYKLDFQTNSKEKVYIFKFDKNIPFKIDSSGSNYPEHTFEIEADLPELFLVGNSPETSVLFIAEKNLQNSIIFKESNSYNVAVTGDSTNIILQQYFAKKDSVIKDLQKLNSSSELNISSKSESIIKSHQKYVKNFIEKNKNSPAILMLLGEITDPLAFQKEILYIKDVVEKKYKNNDYLQQINQVIESAKKQEQLIAQQELRLKQEEEQKKLLGIGLGASAPDISLKNPSGQRIKLSNLRGKIVLLDFWASWCRPCRAENPNVVKLYNKYKSKNFTVYSVSLDKNKEQWTSAIKQDQLGWENHVSELQGWNSSAGAKYGVNSIPKTFLIDKKGAICGYNLKGEALENKIKELLNS